MVKMKTFKRLMGLILATSVTTGLMVGCGSSGNSGTGSSNSSSESDSDETSDESSEEEAQILTAGDENGTELEMWTFVELHAQFYQEMVKE